MITVVLACGLVLPSGIIIIDEMTPRAGQRGLYRALAIASGDAKECTQKTRIRYELAATSNENDRPGRCLGDIDEY